MKLQLIHTNLIQNLIKFKAEVGEFPWQVSQRRGNLGRFSNCPSLFLIGWNSIQSLSIFRCSCWSHVRWFNRFLKICHLSSSLQIRSKQNHHCLWVSHRYESSIRVIILRTNTWKSNDNLAAIKQFNAHPQYNAARIDYDYAFIEMVSYSLIYITWNPFGFRIGYRLIATSYISHLGWRICLHWIRSTNHRCSSQSKSKR